MSILVITYNQAAYIEQAIESALAQRTNFRYEIVIGEDCSTDGTRDAVVDLQLAHPGTIRLLLREQNLGMIENLIQTLQACRGQYVALLEGDDYWICADKLQKQVDFLESHPECVICFHNARLVDRGGQWNGYYYVRADQKETLSIEDLFAISIPTCSAMFQNGLVKEFPDWVRTLDMADRPLHALNAAHGKIGYINQVMSAYRMHPGGAWTSLDQVRRIQALIKWYQTVNKHFAYEYHGTLSSLISNCYCDLAIELAASGDAAGSRASARRCFVTRPLNRRISVRKMGRMLVMAFIPRLYRALEPAIARAS